MPKVKCETCSSQNATRVQRLDPRNLRPEYRRLCGTCARREGFINPIQNRKLGESSTIGLGSGG